MPRRKNPEAWDGDDTPIEGEIITDKNPEAWDGDDTPIEGEIITDISPAGVERILRVYDRSKGDFLLTIPADAKVTFGYFNPGNPSPDHRYGRNDEERRTALRIYKTDKHQLAVFLGVDGFRDTSLTLTRLKQRVTIETNYEDDGLGSQRFQESAKRALQPASEDDEVPF